MKTNWMTKGKAYFVSALFSIVALGAQPAQAVIGEYYIGIDNLQTIATGTYAGLANPNFGRPTFLLAHPSDTNPSTNHYHSIGVYSYSGSASSPTTLATNSNNRIPEISTGQSPLPLLPGTGAFASRFVNVHIPGLEYSDIVFRPTQSLAGFGAGTPEEFLYRSSANRWSALFSGSTNIGLQLLSISAGLGIADDSGANIFNAVNDIYNLGNGDSFGEFEPHFYTAASAAPGNYSATFRLVNLTSNLPGGQFSIDFQRVPEPSVLLLVGLGGTVIGIARVWRWKTASNTISRNAATPSAARCGHLG